MNIQIQVLSTSVETKPTKNGSYQVLEVAYKEMGTGKVNKKLIMSFVNKAVFDTMVLAKPTEYYDITMEKGEKYWEWTSAQKGSAPTVTTATTGGTSQQGSGAVSRQSTYETPEERARKQVYIVRQSSISSAVEILKAGPEDVNVEDVLAIARRLEAWVFGTGNLEAVTSQDVKKLDGFEDPINEPF